MTAPDLLDGLEPDRVAELRALLERWRAEGVEVTREDLLTAIARHQRVQALTREGERSP